MPGKGKPFEKNDPRLNQKGRPKQKTLTDIIGNIGAVLIKDDKGNIVERYEGNERLLKEIIDVGIKEKNPAMMRFIYQNMNTPQADSELAEIKKTSERARATKLEIANAKARGELISRAYVRRVFGEIYSIHRSIFLSGGPTLASSISSKLGIKDDTKKVCINEAVDTHCYKTLTAVKRKIDEFLIATGSDAIDDR